MKETRRNGPFATGEPATESLQALLEAELRRRLVSLPEIIVPPVTVPTVRATDSACAERCGGAKSETPVPRRRDRRRS